MLLVERCWWARALHEGRERIVDLKMALAVEETVVL
jgi:hypothetical protein